ncbi:MAG: dipeptidyl aminopeptidase/acylaminoacyl peptidase, partial [Marinoscillum sp.]
MRFIHCTLLIFLVFSTKAQDSGLLLKQELITDLSRFPIYKRLTEKVDGEDFLKKQYQYIDSINIYGITYLSDGLKINGFLIRPKSEGTYPCIIYNRGGNRDFGALNVGYSVLLFGALASQGYVVIASQYRGNGGSEGQEEFGGKDVNDITILPEVLKQIQGADTEKIGMYGWSRGGMMTYIALTKMDKINAAVVGGAVSDSNASILDRPEMESKVYAELIPNYDTNKEQELD